MKRKSERSDFMFKVHPPDKDRWIFIFTDDIDEPDEFIVLVKAYRDILNGKIIEVSDMMQYKIDNDELGLIFQWDDCFGITVVVPDKTDLIKAYNALIELCESLNHIISQETIKNPQATCDEE